MSLECLEGDNTESCPARYAIYTGPKRHPISLMNKIKGIFRNMRRIFR